VAVAGYGKRAAQNPSDGEAHLRLGIALDGAGRSAEGLKAIETAWDLGRRGPRDTALPAARAAARSGNVARAMHWINVLLSTPFVTLADLQADEAFREIAKTPEFDALVRAAEEQRRVMAMLEGSEPQKALQILRADSRIATEAQLNAAGYRLLGAGKEGAALEVFALAALRHPQSANAWESYSEALEKAGRTKKALETAQRALSLAPPPNVRDAAEARVKRLSKRESRE
jgi:tetratricopeptide (TPR) repeat protein